MLDRLSVRRTPSSDPSRDTIEILTAASWLGLGDQLNIPLGPAIGHAKKINLTRLCTDAEGYEQIVPADQPDPPSEKPTRDLYDLYWTSTQGTCTGSFALNSLTLAPPIVEPRAERVADPDLHDAVLRAVSDAARKISAPPDEEVFRQRAKANGNKAIAQQEERFGRGDDEGVDWKKRCLALEFGARIAQGEMFRYKERLMEEILNVLQ